MRLVHLSSLFRYDRNRCPTRADGRVAYFQPIVRRHNLLLDWNFWPRQEHRSRGDSSACSQCLPLRGSHFEAYKEFTGILALPQPSASVLPPTCPD